PKTSIICSPMTSLKTSIKTITYLSDIGCLEIQGASLTPSSRQFFMTTIRQVVVIKLFGARGAINSHFIFLKVNRNNPVSSQIIYYVMFYGTL
ncbi:hypothetical protein, partial [Escherichia coli]|uniref:hypothetical protein n=1 Tax=Escherichia coli TaxID=562 RepID=UPI001ADE569F